jgi:hypothetical protein
MVASEAGDSIEFSFEGTMAGFYDIMGPSAGVVECVVDGRESSVLRFDKYCTYYRIGSKTISTGSGLHNVSFRLTDRDIDKASILKERGSSIDDPSRYKDTNWFVGNIMLIGDIVAQ